MNEMPKRYDAKETEKKWPIIWEEKGIYKFDSNSSKPVFSIDTPPPTLSGRMHIGHSFSYSQQDFIARFKRMQGFNVFFPFGTDDNGLATDKLVEKTKGIKSKRMQRGDYLKICEQTIKELTPNFIQDWKNLGMSCDFEKGYSTISENSQKISQQAFINLYKKGLLFRKETPISWCPQCQTAIAQAEFENVDMSSHFIDIVFKTSSQDLVIATTRPELLGACVALFYHPDDQRYAHLKGKFAKVPLFEHEVPILTDESVEKDKGTGLMMCCTFGDKEDIEKWYKHKLPLKTLFTKNGKLNELGQQFRGLTIKEARKEIISLLEESGLVPAKKQITHAVNVHERCGTEVEFIQTKQWFVNILDHKQELLDAADKINWYPKHMKARYTHWVQNLNWDWCISRQRHFGIPIPVWYDGDEVILPSIDQLPVDPNNEKPLNYKGQVTPEEDVLDTWATSSLSPMIALGGLDSDFTNSNFPMDLRPQAHDIIRTWAFYTIATGLYHKKSVPWNNIMISGFVLDPKGRKMSKSKGNVIAPQKVIEKYSADAMRYWTSGSKLGDDLPYMEKDVQTGQKTITKLWNASKFSLMHLKDYDGSKPANLELADKWFLSELQKIIEVATKSFEDFEYSKAKSAVDNFFWNTFCDYYLEIIKERIYNPDIHGLEAKKSAQFALQKGLVTILKLFAPIMPYITEEIYSCHFANVEGIESIHASKWPQIEKDFISEETQAAGKVLIEIIDLVRKQKSEQSKSLGAPIADLSIGCSKEQKEILEKIMIDLKAVTKAQAVTFTENDELIVGLKF